MLRISRYHSCTTYLVFVWLRRITRLTCEIRDAPNRANYIDDDNSSLLTIPEYGKETNKNALKNN